MAKKYNKGRKQKPNYSKRGIPNVNVEAGVDLELGKELKDSTCVSADNSICERSIKKR